MNKHILIRVERDDVDKLMTKGLDIYYEHNPDTRGLKITQAFMFKRAVQVYCNEI